MLLLTTQALPQLQAHRAPGLGRLITPRHFPRLAETLNEGFPVAADNDCFGGYEPQAVAKMTNRIAPWPSVATRLLQTIAPAGRDRVADELRHLGANLETPRIHPLFLWLAVPDVLRCACGNEEYCRRDHRDTGCAPVGDADATLERFAQWHLWLAHLPLAFVLQDGSGGPGRVPWEQIAAVFIGGSDQFKLGPDAAHLVTEARRRGLHAHMGRVNSAKRIAYAKSIGCTSVDGTKWVRYRDRYLNEGLRLAGAPPQARLVN